MNILLFSGGIDSNFSSIIKNNNCLFIKINNNCENYIDEKYSFINSKILKKKNFSINLKQEYNFFVKNINLYKNNINIDYYCNKFLKIYILKKIFKIKKIFSGHYIRKIKKFYFISLDKKKDQSYFLNFNIIINSFLGFFYKKLIFYLSIKNNFICYKKKSTKGLCFKIFFYKKKFFIINDNNKIIDFKYNYKLNIGKKYIKNYIIKKYKNQIFLSNYFCLKKTNIIIVKKNINFFFFKIKIKSQGIFFYVKKIIFNKKIFLLFYKNKFFLENNQNVLAIYNDLIIFNFKIKKKN
ncbi:putative tRNA(5-methylaminomethyl-2- thiouridylate) methyltransferase [Candidatus Carsonella ruddii CS isolate Thao2000]|uniref:Putative tRNA(5-methylaminomethyl-2-thiouridylate) methyltransferase n=1 Tax=Candidatus Carsonella ruddii CS isolate Thao2000 TaxID=1202537 RepID=J7GYN1_CARRU|nr:tRNA (5-methylaminomethyl-2-thiouridylate)-methyltransferase [Candidatus Carsonella ruddii]AFP83703.1 putative tRNA(5-methylaminomethyl-2- thiouridylate) methyltransferase [Candidatus Carsonella ruddii CS isolate Thao2000]